jgi:hypothetical protein
LEKKARKTRCKCGKIASRLIRTMDVHWQTVLNNNLERPPHFDANPPFVVWFIGGRNWVKQKPGCILKIPCELPDSFKTS